MSDKIIAWQIKGNSGKVYSVQPDPDGGCTLWGAAAKDVSEAGMHAAIPIYASRDATEEVLGGEEE